MLSGWYTHCYIINHYRIFVNCQIGTKKGSEKKNKAKNKSTSHSIHLDMKGSPLFKAKTLMQYTPSHIKPSLHGLALPLLIHHVILTVQSPK